ncbi:MAG: SUMF1/EgtB/PvdO family nonheme iron enzyme [Desulfobacterales bacterium]|nr:SUMF1/EgtB/PvdO family nonheme iron enzyme [Desulfobacterales bacterium]
MANFVFIFSIANSSDVLMGDIDGDGKVELADAIPVLQICAGMIPASAVKRDADISGDGKICLEEAVYVLQIVSENRAVVSAEEISEIVSTQNSGAEQFVDFLQNTAGEEDAKQLTIEWLKQEPNVANAGISASGDIWINYQSGLTGSIIIRNEEDDVSSRISSVKTNEYTEKACTRSSSDNSTSRKVFIYVPFYTVNTNEKKHEFTDQIADLLDNSCPKYKVVYYKDGECTPDSFKKEMKDSDLVVIHTHGNIVKNKNGMEYHCFLTGAKLLNVLDDNLRRSLVSMWSDGKLTVGTLVERYLKLFKVRNTYLGICAPFITDSIGSSSSSIIYNGSCTSSHPDAPHPTLEEAFLGLNSKNAYFGWTDTVTIRFNKETAEELVPKIITEHMTVGDAYDSLSLFPTVCDVYKKENGCLNLGGNKNAYFNKSEDSITNSLAMTFNLIPAGTFMMGSPEDEPGRQSDETLHQVTLTKPFYIQTTEVTQGQWKSVMGENPSYFSNCGYDCPVEQVSWNDVQVFITELNKMGEGTYRLPTEAEWEYAARAGSTTAFANGDITGTVTTGGCDYDSNLNAMSWYCWNSCVSYAGGVDWSSQSWWVCPLGTQLGTQPVAQKQPNAWGLYDMHGNVIEWCRDWYGDYPAYATDPTGPEFGSERVLRYGSWNGNAWFCRSASRGDYPPDKWSRSIGFRLVFCPSR